MICMVACLLLRKVFTKRCVRCLRSTS